MSMLLDALKHKKTENLGILDQEDTFGLHPWFLPCIDLNKLFIAFEDSLDKKKVLAIGECGIDRVKESIAPIEMQKEVFKFQVDLANRKNLPIIVHCVRAFSDVIEILKQINPKVPILFHSFNGNEQIVNELLKFNSYFSQGDSLFKNSSKIKIIPIDRLLLESGDQSTYSLKEIYEKAKIELKCENLEEQIEKNFLKFYNSNNISASDFIKDLNQRFISK